MPPVQTKEQIAQAEKASQALGFSGIDEAKRSISPEDLKTKKEFEVVPPATPTEAPAMQAQLETPIDYTKDLQDKASTAQTAETQSMEQLLASMLETPGETQLTTEAYDEQGVDRLTKELNTYDQQLNVEKLALRRQIERIQDNREGLSETQINNRIGEVERDSYRKQADISVIRAGVARDYSTARAIADRAVAVQLERDKIKNEALRLNYDRNKSLFDKSEQRAFESAQADRERALTKEENRLKAISDYSIEAMKMGAGSDVITAIRSAKTPEEAQAIASEYTSAVIQGERDMEMEVKNAQIASSYHSMDMDKQKLALEYAKIARDASEDGMKLKAEEGKVEKAVQVQFTRANRVIDQIDSVLPKVTVLTSGVLGLAKVIPGTPQKDLASEIESIKANIGFNELQEMRNASPTGGALGQVAVQELEFLQSTIGNLSTLQSPGQLRSNLLEVRQHFSNWKAITEADQTGFITVVNKDGVAGTIPAEELDNALNEGYVLP